MSSLEKIIFDILKQNNINFQQEKIFQNCYNGYYRYDFFCPDINTIIEVNGAQHYENVKTFYKKKSDFLKAQERDRRKISYCLANHIKLYCIPYWEINHITTLMDIFQEKFMPKDKFHNDTVWKNYKKSLT